MHTQIQRNDIEKLKKYNLYFNESWEVVDHFEKLIAEFFGSPYAVATDSCTHALELSLRISNFDSSVVKIPRHTYMSVPMMLSKLTIPYVLTNIEWQGYYQLEPYPVIDAAVHWEKNSYVPTSLMCVSFQFKKHLPIGRGGIILLDDYEKYIKLQQLVRDGKTRNSTQFNSDVTEVGFHYYMTPEDAARGIDLFNTLKDQPKRPASIVFPQSHHDYKDLLEFTVFKEKLLSDRGSIDVCWNVEDFENLNMTTDTLKLSSTPILIYLNSGHNLENMKVSFYHENQPMPACVGKVKEQFSFLEEPGISINRLMPGTYLPWHSDGYDRYCALHNIQDINSICRIVVMIEDSQPGQYIHIGDQIFCNWKAGDWFSWRGPTMHSTANLSTKARYIFQITGIIR